MAANFWKQLIIKLVRLTLILIAEGQRHPNRQEDDWLSPSDQTSGCRLGITENGLEYGHVSDHIPVTSGIDMILRSQPSTSATPSRYCRSQ